MSVLEYQDKWKTPNYEIQSLWDLEHAVAKNSNKNRAKQSSSPSFTDLCHKWTYHVMLDKIDEITPSLRDSVGLVLLRVLQFLSINCSR